MAAAAAPAGGAGSATATAATTTSRFAAACGALSQYVKAAEKARARPVRPLALMPGADVDAAPENQQDSEAGPAQAQQLTIVYGGRALVLDAVPADTAAGLLRLAASAAAKEPKRSAVAAAADMPVARKASLQRFMEKRKGRVAAARAAPYLRAGACADRDELTLAL